MIYLFIIVLTNNVTFIGDEKEIKLHKLNENIVYQ